MKYGVFISYSHKDAKLVTPIVQLIRSMRSDLVFQDTLSIKPGKPWEGQLGDALKQSDVVIVFWCSHSRNSSEVKKEYERAIEEKKDVLPVLLDGSKLPEEIAKYQWIDLQTVIQHKKSSIIKQLLLSIAVIVPIIMFVIVMMVGNDAAVENSYAGNNAPMESMNNTDSIITASPIDSFNVPYPDNGLPETTYSNASNDSGVYILITLILIVLLIIWGLVNRSRKKKNKRQLSTTIVADKLVQQLNNKLPRTSM